MTSNEDEGQSELLLDLNSFIDSIAHKVHYADWAGFSEFEKRCFGHDIYRLAQKHGLLEDFQDHTNEWQNRGPPHLFLEAWIDSFLMFYLSQTKHFLDQVENGVLENRAHLNSFSDGFREMFFQVTAKKHAV